MKIKISETIWKVHTDFMIASMSSSYLTVTNIEHTSNEPYPPILHILWLV